MATSRTFSVPSTPTIKTSRIGQFTPKRTPSTDLTQSSLNARLSKVNQPVLLNVTTTKKYKAPLSAEVRKLSNKPKTVLSPVLGSPTKRDGVTSRPRTPVSPSLKPAASEMDVSNVDPELVLVDSQTVEPGDVSGEIDESALDFVHGKEDKVMVSIRIRPTDSTNAWIVSPSHDTLKLDPAFARHANSSSNSTSYTFDSVLTGTANKPVYSTVARSHVHAAMEGYNAVIFAYGQTASGKTFTLSGTDDEPGIIPRAMREVFGYIKRTPGREYLLRCSYLEIYNETLFDLLAPPVVAKANPVQIQGGMGGTDIVMSPLREEVVTSLKGVKEVLKRGEGNRRTACTDWNERSSRSHSVFRLVIESRDRGRGRMEDDDDDDDDVPSTMTNGRHTPGRQTPGLNGRQTPGPRLQARGGRSVQSSVLSLIDLAGSEKATSSKDRTREGKYINTSLLTLGTVIGTLAENAAKHKADHVPYRNSKLTRMLQPSLNGNARISVICTISPDAVALAETLSTLGFAKRVKGVQLHAKKTEVVDTDALIERYRKEIEELKARLAEREAEAPVRNRRLSAREQNDESKAMKDLNSRIEQLTKLILTSASVDDAVRDHDGEGGGSQPESPIKIDFDMSPYQLQQELLAARLQIETQAHQILSLEASLLARSHATGEVPGDAAPEEKDRVIAEQARTIRELESYEEKKSTGVGEQMEVELRRVRDEIEMEWEAKFEEERKVREEKERWADEVVKAFEKEKKARVKLEEERRALAAFVSKFDSLVLGSDKSSAGHLSKAKVKLGKPLGIPSPGGSAMSTYERRQSSRSFSGLSAYTRLPRISDVTVKAELESEWDPLHPTMDGISLSQDVTGSTFMLPESDSEAEAKDISSSSSSPFRLDHHQCDVRMQMQADALNAPRLLDQAIPEEVENCMLNLSFDECEVEEQLLQVGDGDMSVCFFEEGAGGLMGLGISVNNGGKVPPSEKREVLGNKENLVK